MNLRKLYWPYPRHLYHHRNRTYGSSCTLFPSPLCLVIWIVHLLVAVSTSIWSKNHTDTQLVDSSFFLVIEPLNAALERSGIHTFLQLVMDLQNKPRNAITVNKSVCSPTKTDYGIAFALNNLGSSCISSKQVIYLRKGKIREWKKITLTSSYYYLVNFLN